MALNTAKGRIWPFTMALIPRSDRTSNRPDQDQAGDRGSDTDRAQDVVRRRQRRFHGPPHPGRPSREHQAFNYEQDTHTDEEVGERYGPHRIGTSRFLFILSTGRKQRLRFVPVKLSVRTYGFGAAGGVPALPDGRPKNLKKSESGFS